jgi:hypothetical protein
MDKFNTPVLNEKKFDAKPEHIGAKHSATGVDKFSSGLKGSVKTDSVNRNDWGKAPLKGKFQWVQVGGKYVKKYDQEDGGNDE